MCIIVFSIILQQDHRDFVIIECRFGFLKTIACYSLLELIVLMFSYQ